MTQNSPSRIEAKLVNGSFSAWKHDVIEAMVTDKKLLASDVRVGISILNHVNGGTRQAYPSHAALAAKTHMTARNVIKCLERLRSAGWLEWARGDSRHANTYAFNPQAVADEIARMKADKRRRKELRARAGDMNHSSYQKGNSSGTTVHTPLRTGVHTNTLIGTQTPTRKEAS